MHNFLPIHWITPPCQRSPWNSTKKPNRLDWQDFFFFLPPTLTLRARGSTKVLFHVATFSSLQDTAANTTVILSSTPSPSHWWYDRRGCWKNVKDAPKTKRLQALWTVTAEQLVAASEDFQAQRFFTEETPCFHGRWNLERERGGKKTLLRGHAQTVRAEVPLSSYPAIIAAINQFCGAIFSTAIKCTEGRDAYSHPILPLGHCYNSERTSALQTSLDTRTVCRFYHCSLAGRTSSPEENLHYSIPLPHCRSAPIYL